MGAILGTLAFIFFVAVFLRIDTNVIDIKNRVKKIEDELNSKKEKK